MKGSPQRKEVRGPLFGFRVKMRFVLCGPSTLDAETTTRQGISPFSETEAGGNSCCEGFCGIGSGTPSFDTIGSCISCSLVIRRVYRPCVRMRDTQASNAPLRRTDMSRRYRPLWWSAHHPTRWIPRSSRGLGPVPAALLPEGSRERVRVGVGGV